MNQTATQQITELTNTELIDRYMAAWNETDEVIRRRLIGETWTANASYIDPLVQAHGRDGIDSMIGDIQQRFASLRFRRVTEVDAHNNCLRFGWELGPESGPAVAGGVDFGTVSEEGLLQSIVGFLDFSPFPNRG
jgi:hypothetical protein